MTEERRAKGVAMADGGKRNTMTEAKIKEAFTELMQSKGFDAMTVSGIVRAAGINRGTFYLHYLDKFDLRQQLIDDTIADLTRILITRPGDRERRPGSVSDCFDPEAIAEALRYVKRDYAFFDAVSRSGNDMQMYDRVKDVLKQMLLGQASHVGAELRYSGIPRDYALEILVSAVSSIIWLWIRRGCKETPEEICAIIEKNKTTAPIDILR